MRRIVPERIVESTMDHDQPLIRAIVKENTQDRQVHRTNTRLDFNRIPDRQVMPLGVGFRDQQTLKLGKMGP